jgi:hypothetical protein
MTSIECQYGRKSPVVFPSILKTPKFAAQKPKISERRQVVADGEKRGRNRVYIHIICPGSLTPSFEQVSIPKSSSIQEDEQTKSSSIKEDEKTIDSQVTPKAVNITNIVDKPKTLPYTKKALIQKLASATRPAAGTYTRPPTTPRLPPIRPRPPSKVVPTTTIPACPCPPSATIGNETEPQLPPKLRTLHLEAASCAKTKNRQNLSNRGVRITVTKEPAATQSMPPVTSTTQKLAVEIRQTNRNRAFTKKDPLSLLLSSTIETASSSDTSLSALTCTDTAPPCPPPTTFSGPESSTMVRTADLISMAKMWRKRVKA